MLLENVDYNQILDQAKIATAVALYENLNLSDKFKMGVNSWFYPVKKSHQEWNLYCPKLINLIVIYSNNNDVDYQEFLNQAIIILQMTNRLTDGDGKENLLSFLQQIKIGDFSSEEVPTEHIIIATINYLSDALCGIGSMVKQVSESIIMEDEIVEDEIMEAKKRLTMDGMIQKETSALSKTYLKQYKVDKLKDLPPDAKEKFYKELEKVTTKAIQMFKNDDVDLDID